MNLKDVKLIVYDFDGVMTDNRAILLEDGSEGVYVSRADGQGVSLIKQLGIAQMIISTEVNKVVSARARKLGIPVLQNIQDKAGTLKKYCIEQNVNLAAVLYIGNDVNDLDAMRLVGYPMCPADAHCSIKGISKTIMTTAGGYGVVRELADQLLKRED